MDVHQGQEIDRLEFLVQRGLAANLRADGKIGAHQFGRAHGGVERLRLAFVAGHGTGLPFGGREVAFLEGVEEGHPFRRVLRSQRGAADQIPAAVVLGVVDDPLPEQPQYDQVAVLLVDAGASEFHQFRRTGEKRSEIKFLGAVKSQLSQGAVAHLHAVGSHQGAAGDFFHQDVIANGVEAVHVHAGGVGARQPFAHFHVENLIAQSLRGLDIPRVLRQPKPIELLGF